MTFFSRAVPALSRVQQPVELSGIICGKKIPQSDTEKEVHVYSKNWMNGQKFLGTADVDPNNQFKFNYSPPGNFINTNEVCIKIFEKNRPFAAKGLHGYQNLKPIGKATVQLNNLQKQNMVISDQQIESLTHLEKPTGIYKPSAGYFARLLAAGAPELVKSKISSTLSSITVDKIQNLYNSFGAQYAASEPTIPNLLNDILNGICAIDYEINGNQIKWIANWDVYEFDQKQSLPNATVVARKENDDIIIESISIQFRDEEEQIVIPEKASEEELKWAIYMARSSFALKGESEKHLAEGHLLPGIAAYSFLKTISTLNPLYDVVARYLKNLAFINWLGGNGIIFGEGSVIELSALSGRSVAELIIRYMNTKADYLNYEPIEPISSAHHRAIVGKVHYNVLLDYYTDFVNNNWEKILPFREEIFQWSEDMHNKLSSIPKIMEDRNTFTKDNEGKKLALCLASLVNQSTFLHWSSHSRQQLLTHVDLTSLNLLNKGKGPDGLPIKYGNTPKESANLQLKVSRTLLNFKGHRFVDYANPDLLKRIEPLRDKYLTFPLDEMFVSTEI